MIKLNEGPAETYGQLFNLTDAREDEIMQQMSDKVKELKETKGEELEDSTFLIRELVPLGATEEEQYYICLQCGLKIMETHMRERVGTLGTILEIAGF